MLYFLQKDCILADVIMFLFRCDSSIKSGYSCEKIFLYRSSNSVISKAFVFLRYKTQSYFIFYDFLKAIAASSVFTSLFFVESFSVFSQFSCKCNVQGFIAFFIYFFSIQLFRAVISSKNGLTEVGALSFLLISPFIIKGCLSLRTLLATSKIESISKRTTLFSARSRTLCKSDSASLTCGKS